jgi:hypothetical protein
LVSSARSTLDEGRQQPAVEGDAHGDAGEEGEDELDPAHRVAAELTARTYPGPGDIVRVK